MSPFLFSTLKLTCWIRFHDFESKNGILGCFVLPPAFNVGLIVVVIGDNVISSAIDNIFQTLMNVVSTILSSCVSVLFMNQYVALITFFILINLLAIVLMKKDKQYAQTPNAKRIKESTLLLTAFVGGALGEYYAMYKYKHKTHNYKYEN